MMYKDPNTKIIINRDESHYEVLKLRRMQKRQVKNLEKEIMNLNLDLLQIKNDLLKTLNREANG